MNISVIYATVTGHSKKIAVYLANSLNAKVASVKEDPLLQNVDLLFMVGGIYGGKGNSNLLAYANGLDRDSVKNVAIITTSFSQKEEQKALEQALLDKKIHILDTISCKGSFLFFLGLAHPNGEDLEQLSEKAENLINRLEMDAIVEAQESV